jgi:hypothetical protein
MQNKWIDGLATDHSLVPLFEHERMGALDVEEMESSSKIDLRDVSWWMSIKDACRLEVSIILKKRMHFFSYKKRPFCSTHKDD